MIQLNKEYVLSDNMALLRPTKESDYLELLEISQERSIWKHFTENGYGEENFRSYFNSIIDKKVNGKEYPLTIISKRTDSIAGMTRIYDINNDMKHVRIGHSWLGVDYQGTGLNKHFKYLLFEFLFEEVEMKRVGFGISSENARSIASLESVGCIKEGLLRSFLLLDSGERADIMLYSMLSDEWYKEKKMILKQKLNKLINKE